MTIPPILSHSLLLVAAAKYPLVAVGAFIEGPILMIASGFLLRHHAFQLLPLAIAIIVGDLLGDMLWYGVGRRIADPFIQKYGRFVGLDKELFEKTKTAFLRHHTNILLISKVTLGFGIAKGILMAAGAARVPFKKFVLLNFIGEIVFVAALLSIGYFFGDLYSLVAAKYRFWFVAILVTTIITLLVIVSKYMRKTFLASKI